MGLRYQRGVGLLEVLIAFAVFAIGIVALIHFQTEMVSNRILSGQQNEALHLANNQIDTLRHYETLETTAGKVAYDDIATGSTVVSGATASYTVSWTVTTNTAPAHKVIVVSVSWTGPSGATQTMRLDTIIGRVSPSHAGEVMEAL